LLTRNAKSVPSDVGGPHHPRTQACNALRTRPGSATEIIFRVSVDSSCNARREPSSYLGRITWGERVQNEGFQKSLMEDWDLDLEALWSQSERSINAPGRSPKLVHNLIFSMPPGTPATKVLQAVRRFATNEWALKHRYAMVLHTNEPHPHVHVVVKAMSEQGKRLNIRKPTLRAWRTQFAESARTRRCCECDGARRSGSIRDLPARCGLPREGGSQTRIDLPA
jgi:hypothetical protein